MQVFQPIQHKRKKKLKINLKKTFFLTFFNRHLLNSTELPIYTFICMTSRMLTLFNQKTSVR